jgi:hypothetical protein
MFGGVDESRTLHEYRGNIQGVWAAVPSILGVFRRYGIRATWAAYPAVFLNAHCGFTLAYQGVRCAYWALAQGDTTNAVVTSHLVDAGSDTGEIVYQRAIDIDCQENFLTYPVRQYVAAIPLIKVAIEDFKSGRLNAYKREVLPSAIRFYWTLSQHLWCRLRSGLR